MKKYFALFRRRSHIIPFSVLLIASHLPAQNCVQWIQRTDVGTPGRRYGHAMAYDSHRGVTVFFGGAYSEIGEEEVFFQDTWEYDGTRWVKIDNLIGGPPAHRANHSMCYDPVRREIIVTGGRNELGTVRDTWVYSRTGNSPGVWSLRTHHPPPYVAYAGMAFDERRGVAMLAGGLNDGGYSVWEAWEWNGNEWQAGVRLPGDRSHHAMAYDSLRRMACVQGGGDFVDPCIGCPFSEDLPDLLTFSIDRWASTPPPAGSTIDLERVEHALAYDIARDRLVLFGGSGQNSQFHLEYDPVHGWRVMPFTIPIGRAQPAMVYDSRRGVTVLFGGVGGTRYDDTWELAPIRPVVSLLGPQLQQSCEFDDITLYTSVTAPAGSILQWLHDGQPVPDGNSQSLTLRSVRPSDAGQYALRVTDPCGNIVVSPAYGFVVHTAPTITAFDATRRNRCPGDSVTFSVSASSTLPIRYQWYRFIPTAQWNVPIPGATTDTLTLDGLTHTNTGTYFVEVRNDCDWRFSQVVHLQVGPSILQQPQSVTGNVCAAASFTVQADGVGTLRYQWRLDGARLSNDDHFAGVNSPLLEIRPLLYGHEGKYDVIVTDDCGPINAVTSTVVKLTVKPGPEWWLRTTNGPSPRWHAAMAYDSARRVTVLFGGWHTNASGAYETLGDVWEWDGARWTLRIAHSPTNGWEQVGGSSRRPAYRGQPVHRYGHSMVYDSRRGRVVLFGGESYSPESSQWFLNDVWEWDGTQWLFRTTNGPARRSQAAMAYDSDRDVTVMFGGFLAADPTPRTVWEWNGVQWSSRQYATGAANGPADNYSHVIGGMAYDTFRKAAVFGPSVEGFRGWHFWSWDGDVWKRQSEPAASTPLWGLEHGDLVYDSYRRRSVWFGGTFVGPTNTTGFFDGKDWEVLATSPQWPRGRFGAAMAYDSARHATVMFGGDSGYGRFEPNGDTWELIAVDLPMINEQPSSQYRPRGQTAVFSVAAIGPAGVTLRYQWQRDGVPLADGARISGATSERLSITGVQPGDAGRYRVRIYNDCGSVMSLPAILTLDPNLQMFASAEIFILIWSNPAAVLEQADSPAGPWVEVPGARSPFHPSAFAPSKFFRFRSPAP